ncbi:hypothetical protein [Mucilaginibacter segetis]|nr:hypothetical protein [Mucilaginibacter segetis]
MRIEEAFKQKGKSTKAKSKKLLGEREIEEIERRLYKLFICCYQM